MINGILCSSEYSNDCLRFTDKGANESERILMESWFDEITQKYGQEVTYWVHGYNIDTTADNIYGEDPTSKYSDPVNIIMFLELTEGQIPLSKFGYITDDEILGLIPINRFTSVYSSIPNLSAFHFDRADKIEPKSGDVFKLTEYGNTRPGGRDGKMFEITERMDQDITKINPLAGHYVWIIKAKRLDYSFEPGLQPEAGSYQVADDSLMGRLSGGMNPAEQFKPYTHDVDNISKTKVFDMDNNNNDEVYGKY